MSDIKSPSLSISLETIIKDILPKLSRVERVIADITENKACLIRDPYDKKQLQNKRARIELEVMMVKTHIQHLMSRYPHEIQSMENGTGGCASNITLQMTEEEKTMIDRGLKLHSAVMDMVG